MVNIRSLVISIFPLVLLLTEIDASPYQLVRQKRADVCPNPTGNTCFFVICENGGRCIEDPNTIDCFTCQCTAGYTGKVCNTPVPILPVGCNPGCSNGGRCNINVCECPVGYTGTYCETRNYCSPINPCQNGGRCTSTASTYQCDCTGTGFTGTTCTVAAPTNPCASNPCQNGGFCSWDGTTMNCLCVNDYTGLYCQIVPVPCAAAPCLNGGTCQLLATNKFGCACTDDYTGPQCEKSILENHPCVTMPTTVCLNGGVCTVDKLNYLCKCAAGWSGTNCQTPAVTSSCAPDPCGAHGTCFQINLPIGPTVYCNCENRWTGKYCDTNMDATCPVGYCITGTCQMVGNVPLCSCPPLYTGQRCDTLVNAMTTIVNPITTTTPVIGGNGCLSYPCKNGGTCYSNSDAYRCECLNPWSGDTCEQLIVPITTTESPIIPPGIDCSENPCYNGGVCYPNGDSITCACGVGYTGLFCEMIETTMVPTTTTPDVPMICADQPCQNGGTCVPMGSSYSCFCGVSSIYTGQNCDSTTPMPASECPLDCTPGRCVFSGNAAKPYACLWGGVMRPVDGTTG